MKSGNLNFLEPSGPLQACNGTALPLLYYRPEVFLFLSLFHDTFKAVFKSYAIIGCVCIIAGDMDGSCVIVVFRRGADDILALLGCHTA
jgi:hypothetical protein